MADVTGSGTAATVATEGSGAGTRGIHDVGETVDLYLPLFSGSGAGTVTPSVHGNGAGIIAPMQAIGAGTRIIVGNGAIVLPAFVGAGGDSPAVITGNGSAIIAAMQAAGTGHRVITPNGSPVELLLTAFSGSGLGTREVIGVGAVALPAMQGSGLGAPIHPGSGAAFLPPFDGSGSGTVIPSNTGVGVAVLAPMIASGAGHRVIRGTGVILLPVFSGSGASPGQHIIGIGEASIAAMLASGSGIASEWNGPPAPPWLDLGGWFASWNPWWTLNAGAARFIAAQPNGVALARFAWVSEATGVAQSKRVLPEDAIGFVASVGLNTNAIYQSIGRWWLRPGAPVAVYSKGDFVVRFEGGAIAGNQVYARFVDGAPISGYAANAEATPWYVVTNAAPGELAVISTTSRVQ